MCDDCSLCVCDSMPLRLTHGALTGQPAEKGCRPPWVSPGQISELPQWTPLQRKKEIQILNLMPLDHTNICRYQHRTGVLPKFWDFKQQSFPDFKSLVWDLEPQPRKRRQGYFQTFPELQAALNNCWLLLTSKLNLICWSAPLKLVNTTICKNWHTIKHLNSISIHFPMSTVFAAN